MAQIQLQAKLEGSHLLAAGMSDPNVGEFIVDTHQKLMTFQMPKSLAGSHVEIRGFVPRGWASEPVYTIGDIERQGRWHYEEWQEKNILAGLTYLSITRSGTENRLRAQIDPVERPEPRLEDFVTTTALAGACETFISIPGIFDKVPVQLEPAQVVLARSAARTTDDGRREQDIGCQIRVGGAHVPGMGHIEIQMHGEENPGHIISINKGADFPARMRFDVRKRYMTPRGNFYSDLEQFVAEIPSYPPFGTRFQPVQSEVPLKDEQTDKVVGNVHLGWLTPLCYLDKHNFPPKYFPLPTEDLVR